MFSSIKSNIEDDDDDFFPTTTGSSKLASLFEGNTSTAAKNPALTYTAPKQPSANKMPQNNPTAGQQTLPAMSAITVAAVTCYILKGEKYELVQGKLGFALLGNHEAKIYQLILYQGKQKPITTVRVMEQLNIALQPNNFCSFYDDRNQNWAIMFESKEAATKFLNEIELMKTKLSPRAEQVPQQEAPKVLDEPKKVKEESLKPIENPMEDKKANLLSRMAKMGQPILPLPGAAVAQPSSSSDEDEESSPEPIAPAIKAKPIRKPHRAPSPIEPMQSGPMLPASYGPLPSFPFMQYIPTPAVNVAASNPLLEALISETRTHNSEIRMHLCRLTDKLDLVLQKGAGSSGSGDLDSFSRTQSAKLDDIVNLLKGQHDVSTVEKERQIWFEKFNESQREIADLRQQLSEIQTTEKDQMEVESLKSEIRELREKLSLYESTCAEVQKNNQQLRMALDQEKEEKRILEEKLEKTERGKSMAESLAETLQKSLEEKDKEMENLAKKTTEIPNVTEEVKKVMNVVYKRLLKQFQQGETYDYAVIKSLISTTVREVTLSMLSEKEPEVVPEVPAEAAGSNPVDPEPSDRKEGTETASMNEGPSEEDETSGLPEVDTGNTPEPEVNNPSISLQETLEKTLSASVLNSNEPVWKPEPPPPPLFDDLDNEDGWLI